jgi:protein O-GlcNAc transferase
MQKGGIEQAKLHLQQGQMGEAEQELRGIISHDPRDAEANHLLGIVLCKTGREDEGFGFLHTAIRLDQTQPAFFSNFGVVLADRDPESAAKMFSHALELAPDNAQMMVNLGATLQRLGLMDKAVEVLRRAVELSPDFADARLNLGNALREVGDVEEAIAHFRRAVELNPSDAELHGNLLYVSHFDPRSTEEDLAAEHARWYERHARGLKPRSVRFENDRNPQKKLRIGYVSPELRQHPVGRFMLPLLEGHDKNRVEVFCYHTGPEKDQLTDRLRARTDVWRNAANLSDQELAQQIREDHIDVLVDLNMHMRGSRLLAFARRAAPVQVTYLAYAGTTGLLEMDYRITDQFLDPQGTDGKYVEKMAKLKSYWCYSAPENSPAVQALPASRNAGVMFGCLNSYVKVNRCVLEVWKRTLEAVPGSRMILFASEGKHRDRLQEFFGDGRLEFVGKNSLLDYLTVYHRIDVALDSFPYVGGTTTCDAMWMGVPVVTLAGKTAIERGGVSILNQVGLPQLVARSEDEYVRIAANLAKDLPKLAELRAGLRQRMMESPLMDGKGFAADVENRFQEMWWQSCQQAS